MVQAPEASDEPQRVSDWQLHSEPQRWRWLPLWRGSLRARLRLRPRGAGLPHRGRLRPRRGAAAERRGSMRKVSLMRRAAPLVWPLLAVILHCARCLTQQLFSHFRGIAGLRSALRALVSRALATLTKTHGSGDLPADATTIYDRNPLAHAYPPAARPVAYCRRWGRLLRSQLPAGRSSVSWTDGGTQQRKRKDPKVSLLTTALRIGSSMNAAPGDCPFAAELISTAAQLATQARSVQHAPHEPMLTTFLQTCALTGDMLSCRGRAFSRQTRARGPSGNGCAVCHGLY